MLPDPTPNMPEPAVSRLKLFLGFLGLLYLLVAADLADGVVFLKDVDDDLRLVQIKTFLSSGHWFDLSLPSIRMPEIYVSPWSRLVDLPYVVLTQVFTLFAGPELALRLATWIWPPAMLAIFAGLAFVTMSNLNGRQQPLRPISLVATGILMALAVGEFAPGRIDHHNVQLVLMMALLAGVSCWSRFGGTVAGVAAALSIVVGLECLPFVAVAIAGLALAFVFGAAGAGVMLRSAGASMFATALLAGLAFIGPSAMAATACDAYSAPYIAALCGFSAILWGAATLCADRTGLVRRLLYLVLSAIAITGLLAAAFPECIGGPYQMIDPVSKAFWFDRIMQEHNVLHFRNDGSTGMTMLALFGLLAIIAVFSRPIAADFRGERLGGVIIYGVAVASLLLSIVLIRYVRFPAGFVPLFVPLVLSRFERVQQTRSAAYSLMLLALPVAVAGLVVAGIYAVVPHKEEALDAVFLMSIDSCDGEDLSALAALPSGSMILSPTGLSLSILKFGRPDLSIGAIPFHRASPGIRRSFLAFTTKSESERREALAPFGYLAVCRVPLDVAAPQAPLYAALAKDAGWPGLTAVDASSGSRFRVFQIDHSALR